MPSPQDHAAWMRLAGMPPVGEFYERIIAELYAQRLAPGALEVVYADPVAGVSSGEDCGALIAQGPTQVEVRGIEPLTS